jgi:hypothetical protein
MANTGRLLLLDPKSPLRRSQHSNQQQQSTGTNKPKFQRSITMNAIQRHKHLQFVNASLSASSSAAVVTTHTIAKKRHRPEPTTYDRLFGNTVNIRHMPRQSESLYNLPRKDASSLNDSTTGSSSVESIPTNANNNNSPIVCRQQQKQHQQIHNSYIYNDDNDELASQASIPTPQPRSVYMNYSISTEVCSQRYFLLKSLYIL